MARLTTELAAAEAAAALSAADVEMAPPPAKRKALPEGPAMSVPTPKQVAVGPRPVGRVDQSPAPSASSTAASSEKPPTKTVAYMKTDDGFKKLDLVLEDSPEREFHKGDHPEWPNVKCASCNELSRWSQRLQVSKDMPGNMWCWVYTCIRCCALKWGVTENEAAVRIFQSRPGWEKKQGKIKAFTEAKHNRLEQFPMMKGRALYQLARQDLMEVFKPMASVIIRKMKALCQQVVLNDEYLALLAELKITTDLDVAKDLLNRIESLSEKIESLEGYLAFKARAGDDAERHRRYILAAEYADSWCSVYDSRGRLVGSILSVFVCLGNNGWERCASATGSKRWLQKHADPLARKQAWYCPVCGCRYKASWGLVLEFLLVSGERCYARSEVDAKALDLKAMHLEEQLEATNPKALDTPEGVYNAVPEVFPWTGDGSLWRAAKPTELCHKDGNTTGVFRSTVPVEFIDRLPWMKWEQVLRFFEEQ